MDQYQPNFLNYYTPFQLDNKYGMFVENPLKQRIEMEILTMRQNFTIEENAFVEKSICENPVVIERRKIPIEEQDYRTLESLQRAESCRKSRINNKIKKARMRFRHQFANQKMLQSSCLENRLESIIGKAEMQLLTKGVSPQKLKLLRAALDLERPQTPTSPDMYWQHMGHQ